MVNKILNSIRKFKFYIDVIKNRKCIVLVNTPTHGNLGDQAIAVAEREFLKNYLSEYHVVELSADICANKFTNFRFLSMINRNTVFLIHAGGYLGDLWPEEEERIKKILKDIKKNKKVILPQTYYIKDQQSRMKMYESDKAFYGMLTNVYICLRDQLSYNTMIQNVLSEEQCILVPDIVTYLNPSYDNSAEENERNGVLLCIRSDHEKVLTDNMCSVITCVLEHLNLQYEYTDTCVDYQIFEYNRKEELLKKWNEFSKAQLVITDRIHGMLFSAITNTPCIAIDNVSKKVSGAYEWVKYLEYIKLVKEIDESKICNLIQKLIKLQNIRYTNDQLSQYYNQLAELIREKK